VQAQADVGVGTAANLVLWRLVVAMAGAADSAAAAGNAP